MKYKGKKKNVISLTKGKQREIGTTVN